MNNQSSAHSLKALTQYFQRVEAVDVPHTGKSYLAHAIGVYRDLKAWGWTETAARAGLFHSIYGTEIFQGFTLPLSQRDEIRSMIGDHAEFLCYLNCALKRRQFDTEVARGFGPYRIADRFENTLIDPVTLCFWNCANCIFVTGWNRSLGRRAGITVARATDRLLYNSVVLDFRNTEPFSTGPRNRPGSTAISGLKAPRADQHAQ